jgi:NitT/TauT family transport system substrate-binding protein
LISAGVLLGCARQSGPAVRTVRIALSRDGITWLPLHLAEALGYYRDEGVALTVSDVAGLSKGMEALLGGSADVAGSTTMLVVQLAAEGRTVRSFLTFYTSPNYALVVAPSAAAQIRTVADLKGRRVGISSPGSPTQLLMNYSLVSHGLSPEDVSTVSISTGAASVAAIERGQVDAAALVGSAITVLEKRYPASRILADTRTPAGTQAAFGSSTLPSASLVTTEDWLKTSNDTARRLTRATLKAMQWMSSHSAEEARTYLPEALRMPDAEGDLEAIRLSQRNLSRDGAMPADGLETARRVLAASNDKVRTGTLDLSRFYTNEFVLRP